MTTLRKKLFKALLAAHTAVSGTLKEHCINLFPTNSPQKNTHYYRNTVLSHKLFPTETQIEGIIYPLPLTVYIRQEKSREGKRFLGKVFNYSFVTDVSGTSAPKRNKLVGRLLRVRHCR